MLKKLALLLLITSTSFAQSTSVLDEITSILDAPYTPSLNDVNHMLHQEGVTLNEAVINHVLATIACTKQYNIEQNKILTIIDYSQPSSAKRLWVFDMKAQTLLFNTYVSHGIKSGVLLTTYFSNKYDSKASSLGVYKTEKAYYGRHGLSLKLNGLERGFNDNAENRAVVMHGGWYVEDAFIKKYGRAGRSWGCPAVPNNLASSIINTIKDKSLFVVYSPNDSWLLKSKFLTCSSQPNAPLQMDIKPPVMESDLRDDILFADINKNNKHEESEPVAVMTADDYARTFHQNVPLGRMLRCQFNNTEYIALSPVELTNIMSNTNALNTLCFVIPKIVMQHGYYATEMQRVVFGKIKSITLNDVGHVKSFAVSFDSRAPVTLKTTNRFIRWVGL